MEKYILDLILGKFKIEDALQSLFKTRDFWILKIEHWKIFRISYLCEYYFVMCIEFPGSFLILFLLDPAEQDPN